MAALATSIPQKHLCFKCVVPRVLKVDNHITLLTGLVQFISLHRIGRGFRDHSVWLPLTSNLEMNKANHFESRGHTHCCPEVTRPAPPIPTMSGPAVSTADQVSAVPGGGNGSGTVFRGSYMSCFLRAPSV